MLHIEYCKDYEKSVSKTTSLTRLRTRGVQWDKDSRRVKVNSQKQNIQSDTKNGELLKNPTKIVEIQKKNY
jgi:hypothetical protein